MQIEDSVETKFCGNCWEIKDISCFYKNRNRKHGLATYCKPCHEEKTKISRDKNPEHHKEKRREWLKKTNYGKIYLKEWKGRPGNKDKIKFYNVKASYGITKEEYFLVLEEQKHKCGICDNNLTDKNRAFDHCHITKKNRGFLCNKCNSNLGWYEKRKDKIQEWIK